MNYFKYIITILIIITVSLCSLNCGREPNLLPEQLYGCTLTSRLRGEEAKSHVDQLHFQKVAAHSTEIGRYEGENGPITIYVTSYLNADQAEENYKKMTKKISPENSVFIAGEYLKIGEKEVYRCFGMGQTHFVLVHQKNLIWLSVDTIRANKILDTYLKNLT
jgi:hypothetical protein